LKQEQEQLEHFHSLICQRLNGFFANLTEKIGHIQVCVRKGKDICTISCKDLQLGCLKISYYYKIYKHTHTRGHKTRKGRGGTSPLLWGSGCLPCLQHSLLLARSSLFVYFIVPPSQTKCLKLLSRAWAEDTLFKYSPCKRKWYVSLII
jgi:hypothetical protein